MPRAGRKARSLVRAGKQFLGPVPGGRCIIAVAR